MEVHHCIHCGTEAQPSWRFCRRCGTALEGLADQATVARCSNCSTAVAEGWRFCANCGTGTDTATPAGGGLSDEEVADLIAPAAPSPAEPATEATARPGDTKPPQEADTRQDITAPAPAERPEPTLDSGPATSPDESPQITAAVSFQPSDRPQEPAPPETGAPPPRPADVMASPPPPPPDPVAERDEIATVKAHADAPPAAPTPVPQGEVVDAVEVEVVEAAGEAVSFEPAAAATDAASKPPPTEIVPPPVEDAAPSTPAVTIPGRDDAGGGIIRGIPKPLGEVQDPSQRSVPSPIGLQRDDESGDLPTPADRARSRVAVPGRPDRAQPTATRSELPPLDSRYRNPGLPGQGVQLALIASAALAVAMIVALTVLNNRLDAYASTGESLSRVQSAESILNSWLRPMLIGAILLTYAAVAVWSRRVVANLAVFDNPVEETALWMWIVPGVNMWVLFQHFDLAFKGATSQDRNWKRGRPDWWTGAFVVLPVVSFGLLLYASFLGADSFEQAIDANAFSMIGYFLLAVGLLCGVRAIGNIIEHQRARVERLG